MIQRQYLRNVPLPPGLTQDELYEAIIQTHEFFRHLREESGIVLSHYIQSNNFSGVVSNVFSNKLSDVSNYTSHHDQQYPDLINYENNTGLEVKATIRLWKGAESHNAHSGWHLVACFVFDENEDVEIVQLEIANLIGFGRENSDWNYNGSSRNSNGSQRTETYNTNDVGTAKLRDGSVYINTEYVRSTPQLRAARRRVNLPIPRFSPFHDENFQNYIR